MSKRYDAIGIKQAIRLEWMQKTVSLLLAGFDAKSIRQELAEYISDKRANGIIEKRSDESRNQIVGILMKVWVLPEKELIPLRNASLNYVRENPSKALAVHWWMISASYPFWFNVARQTGRLLALQDQVTKSQIINRLKEHYGDRQTVSRYALFVIRSFVAWGVLNDSDSKGCYAKTAKQTIIDVKLLVLMLEAALLTTVESKSALGVLLNNPGFFPFQLPAISGDLISQSSTRINVLRYGLDDELLQLIND